VTQTPTQSPQTAGRHAEATRRLLEQYAAIPPGEPVRLAKRTSNLFRNRPDTTRPGLDVSGLDQVLSVDPVARTADVQGMTTYETLVDATLPHGLMPLVVPQLKTITLGGAVTGLGIESTSFRNGLPHESALEIEILTGDGEVVVATPDGPHADLFQAFPNSYGTLGYALRVKIELEPVHPFVRLRHVHLTDLDAVQAAIARIVEERSYDGEPVDFLDGTVFSPDEIYLTLGTWADTAPYTSDYTGQQIYYRSIQQRSVDFLTIRDYLWRWDTDWFWCSRAFGAQNPRIRRVWPRKWLRSNVYWKIVAFEDRHHVMARIDARRGLPARERVIQDVEIPIDRTAEFLRWFDREVPIEPVWLCPIQLRDNGAHPAGEQVWPLYPLEQGQLYVNVGFWSTVAIEPGRADGDVNRMVETQVDAVGGHKSLYSDAYYDEADFWARYGGGVYSAAKERYDPKGRLLDLYAKAVRRR
jgi:FAD/FMN-containing dehydrogenase